MIKRLTVAVAALLLLSVQIAGAAGLYPLSNYQQFDANGKLMVGARLFLYNGGTTTPRTGYKDSSLTSPHPTPIVADAKGRLPLIYLADGFYRQRLTDKDGAQQFDQDGIPVLSTTAQGSGTSVDPDSIYKSRDIKIRFDNQPLSGYVRLNGRTIGSAASGATERANSDTQALYEELWPFSTITVVGGKGASAAADFAANKPLTLPNAAGRGIFGVDDMGAGAQSVLTSATITAPTAVGSVGGFQTVTISQAMLPSYTLTGGSGSVTADGTTGTESATHSHSYSGTTGGMNRNNPHSHAITVPNRYVYFTGSESPGGIFYVPQVGSTAGADIAHEHGFSGTTTTESAAHTHTVTVNGSASSVSIASGGSGAASANLPPVILFTIYIRL